MIDNNSFSTFFNIQISSILIIKKFTDKQQHSPQYPEVCAAVSQSNPIWLTFYSNMVDLFILNVGLFFK